MIGVGSKRKKTATILKKYPDAILADVTSGAKDGLRKLSPFYPHYGIPVHQIPRLLVVNPFFGFDEETAARPIGLLISQRIK